MRAVVLVCLLVGCAYKPGSFGYVSQTFPGQRTTAGCLDLAVERRADMESSAVLGFQFGNRCDHATVVDLPGAAVIGRTAAGVEIELAPFDPGRELEAVSIDGRIAGGEAIAYPAAEKLAQVCVDVASVARAKPAQWICFGDGGS